MWMIIGSLGLLLLLAIALKVMERRASKDATGEDDLSAILRGRLGRGDPSGGGWVGDGGGGSE